MIDDDDDDGGRRATGDGRRATISTIEAKRWGRGGSRRGKAFDATGRPNGPSNV
jgi:hypothetical protein